MKKVEKSIQTGWTSSATPLYRRTSNLPDAQVAQLVEHVTENHGVGGSIPPLGTILFKNSAGFWWPSTAPRLLNRHVISRTNFVLRVPSARTIARLMTTGRDTLSRSETITIAAKLDLLEARLVHERRRNCAPLLRSSSAARRSSTDKGRVGMQVSRISAIFTLVSEGSG